MAAKGTLVVIGVNKLKKFLIYRPILVAFITYSEYDVLTPENLPVMMIRKYVIILFSKIAR